LGKIVSQNNSYPIKAMIRSSLENFGSADCYIKNAHNSVEISSDNQKQNLRKNGI